MKTRAPAFQFYPRQFCGDDAVMAMDLDTVGAHILLMCVAAASPEYYRIPTGLLPDGCRRDAEERAIRNRLRNPANEDWQRIKGQLLSGAWKISEDGQWWEQDGLRRSFEKQKEFSEAQRKRANSRYGNDAQNTPGVLPECHRNDTEMAPENCSTSSSTKIDISPNPSPAEDPALTTALLEVWHYYLERVNRDEKTYQFTPTRKRKGLQRLKECKGKVDGGDLGKAAQLMMAAVDGLSDSDWHMGRDLKTGGKRYCDWHDHLFGSYERMERWWNQ